MRIITVLKGRDSISFIHWVYKSTIKSKAKFFDTESSKLVKWLKKAMETCGSHTLGPLQVSTTNRSTWFYTEKLGRKSAVTLCSICFSNLFFLRAGDKSPKARLKWYRFTFLSLNPWNILWYYRNTHRVCWNSVCACEEGEREKELNKVFVVQVPMVFF